MKHVMRFLGAFISMFGTIWVILGLLLRAVGMTILDTVDAADQQDEIDEVFRDYVTKYDIDYSLMDKSIVKGGQDE